MNQVRLMLSCIIVTMAISVGSAHAQVVTLCPAGHALRGINFATRSIVCEPVDSAALLDRIAVLEAALANVQTIPCLSQVGTEVSFEGCNVHIRSGGGATNTVNGLGNLIIGYNEDNGLNVRTGSHNLVVGPFHTYSSFGGFVAGSGNAVTGESATVTGGAGNTASGFQTSVTGGFINTASGNFSSVTGGTGNTASGNSATVSGGQGRSASGGLDWAAGGLLEDF